MHNRKTQSVNKDKKKILITAESRLKEQQQTDSWAAVWPQGWEHQLWEADEDVLLTEIWHELQGLVLQRLTQNLVYRQ